MIGVFVTFRYEDSIDADAVGRIATAAGEQFRGMPGLRNKFFTVDAEAGVAENFYVWESEEAARAFFTPELSERVTGLYGVAPDIRFVQIAELVDNSQG
jgi:hypothetical protein